MPTGPERDAAVSRWEARLGLRLPDGFRTVSVATDVRGMQEVQYYVHVVLGGHERYSEFLRDSNLTPTRELPDGEGSGRWFGSESSPPKSSFSFKLIELRRIGNQGLYRSIGAYVYAAVRADEVDLYSGPEA